MNERIISAAVLVLAMAMGGCYGPAPGLRWAPDESQKQAGQIGADLGRAAATHGLPPESAAAQRLAATALAGSRYMGWPDQAVDTAALTPPAVRDAWRIRNEQVDRLRLREKWANKTSELTARGLAELIDECRGQASIAVATMIHRVQAIGELGQAAAEIGQTITVPGEPSISEEEAARLERLDQVVAQITAAAEAQAARRPTVKEAAERTAEHVEDVIGEAEGLLERTGLYEPLLALLGTTGIGGVVAGYLQRRRRVTAEAKLEVERRNLTDVEGAIAEIVRGVDIALDSEIGAAAISVAGDATTVAEAVKAVLGKAEGPLAKAMVADAKRIMDGN